MPTPHRATVPTALLAALALLAGPAAACSTRPAAGSAGAGGTATAAAPSPARATSAAAPRTIAPTYAPAIRPADFTTTIDNPYFPLVPGTRYVYDGTTAEGRQHTVVEVTRDTRTVMGVQTRVVHDVVSVNGRPEEETFDWYAQDREGNVWYFGEATEKLAGGIVDTKGSFEAGVKGALPGIIMPSRPVVGDSYRQEYARGEAEDTAKVLNLNATEKVPFGGRYGDLVVTEDVNPLDPAAAVENKYYAKGIGFLAVVHVTGPRERVELTAVERF
jgi:hypothetical protein